MSEKFTSKQDRADAIDEVRDFVDVDSLGRARVPTGSGSKGGKFLSDHEIKMIEAHASQIYDGLDNRENEALLDSVGILEEPEDIRASLAHNGFIDDSEEADWTDQELMNYVDGVRNEVEEYYTSHDAGQNEPQVGKRRADVAVDAPSQAEGYVRQQDRQPGRHRAETDDERTPLFDELVAELNRPALAQEANEGESLEEYEARHIGGRHAAPLPVESLDAIASGQATAETSTAPLPTGELEVIAAGENNTPDSLDDSNQSESAVRTRRQRIRDMFTPSGFAVEMGRLSSTTKEKLGKHKKASLAFGVLAVAGTVAAIYVARHNGHASSGGGSGGGFFDHLADGINDSANDIGEKAKDAVDQRHGNGGDGTHEAFSASDWNIPKGSGGEALMTRLGVDKSVWYEHQDEFLKLFPNEAYRMSDGNVGFDDPGRLSKGAIDFWTSAASK